MIELNEQQRQELNGSEPVAIDPATNQTHVLVKSELYQRVRHLFDDEGLDMRQVGFLIEEAMREDDANDPLLESYQNYRRTQ
jgi:hypothetical protein